MLKTSNFVVGLTGGIGSGKSTAATQFRALGIEVIDADSLSREVVNRGSPALAQIAGHFGKNILNSLGELDRASLREIVFSDNSAKVWLEQLLHPLIADLMQLRLANSKSDYCILESPLLLETRQHELVDRVLVVDVREETQLSRTLQRDNGETSTIQAIIASQMNRKDRLQKADDILDNEAEEDTIATKVARLHEQYLEMSNE